eukprot:gnl/Dysnectes_brevis/3839_a4954_649.p1 GENE.gnl/Dysnectes_brevis/3839_a4954_649~~gnl/Dysnectes_brevis/3839_a4954_649.p1  ORF type:complete len:304 (-),score=75.02 gnl/Dysnectes_brevis/3839_a4954_649:40-951(-)
MDSTPKEETADIGTVSTKEHVIGAQNEDEKVPSQSKTKPEPEKSSSESSSSEHDMVQWESDITLNEKMGWLFKAVSPAVRSSLKMNKVAFYSVTPSIYADQIAKEIRREFPRISKVVDGTACVGGDTRAFSKHFPHVHSIELNQENYHMLQHNVRELGLRNVTTHQGDSRLLLADVGSWAPAHAPYLLYFDPPWGGPEYIARSTVQTMLGDTPIQEVVLSSLQLPTPPALVVLKLPSNADQRAIREQLAGHADVWFTNKGRKLLLCWVQSRRRRSRHERTDDRRGSYREPRRPRYRSQRPRYR